jgi:hypothetical protein
VRPLSTSSDISEPTSTAPTVGSTSTKKATAPARLSNVRIAGRNSGAEKFASPFVTNGKPWTRRELTTLRKHADLPLDELVKFFPGRTGTAVKSKRSKMGFTGKPNRDWTREEDNRLRDMCSRGMGWTTMSREIGIDPETIRWRCLNKLLIQPNKPKVQLTGEALVDAVRQRAAEDGIAMRALDRELGTGTYFTSNCELRAKRGARPDMNAIAKAVEFFGGEMTINWRDE